MCVDDGEVLSWISTSLESVPFLYTGNTRKGHSQPCLSSLRAVSLHHQARTTSLWHLGRAIAYVKSASRALRIGNWEKSWERDAGPGAIPGADRAAALLRWSNTTCRSRFPIRSWVDLPHVCNSSVCLGFHLQDCQNCFCPLLTLSTSSFLVSLIPGTFHPRQ